MARPSRRRPWPPARRGSCRPDHHAAHGRAGRSAGIVGEDQRVVGHGIGLAHQHQRGMAQLVEAGAHHLRLAAQAVGVLHAVVAFGVCEARIALPASSRGSSAPRRSAPAGRAARGCAGRTGRRCRARRPPSARRRRAPLRAPARTRAARAGQRGRGLRAVDQRQAFLGLEHERCHAAALRADSAGTRWPPTSISPSPIRASVMCDKGARSPEAPTEP
jgi:hypothetical protein